MANRIITSTCVKVSSTQAKDAAASATLTVLAAAANKIPHVHGVVISTDTPGTYTLKIGATTKMEFYLGDDSGYGQMFHPFYLANETAEEAITLTKPSGATTSVTLFYTLENTL